MAFTPRVFEEQYRPDPAESASAIGDAIDTYYRVKDQRADRDRLEVDRAYQDELRDRERAGRDREDVLSDIQYGETLRDLGLEPVDDAAPMERDPLRNATPGFAGPLEPTPRGLEGKNDTLAARAEREKSGERQLGEKAGIFSPKDAFKQMAELGPEAMKPSVLPGQFMPDMGFARRPVYRDELEAMTGEIVEYGGQRFRRTGSSLEERQEAAMRDEIERLVAAGVPESVARFAAEDEVLAREYLRPKDEEAGERAYSYDELVAAGLPEDLARIGALSPDFGGDVIGEHLARTRPRPASGAGGPSVTEQRYMRDVAMDEVGAIISQAANRSGGNFDTTLAIAAESVRQMPGLSQYVSPAMVEGMVREVIGGGGAPSSDGSYLDDLPADVEERRDNILDLVARPPVNTVEQDIVNRLAGIGHDGRPIPPMSATEIIDGLRAAGWSAEEIAEIEAYLRRLLPRSSSRGR